MIPALVADPAKDHLDGRDPESAGRRAGKGQAGELLGNVTHVAAFATHDVVVVVFDVGIDAHTAGPDVEQPHFAERLEVVHSLIHGLEGDRRHRVPHGVVEAVDGEVRRVAVEVTHDAFTLRSDAQATVPHQHPQLVDAPHER